MYLGKLCQVGCISRRDDILGIVIYCCMGGVHEEHIAISYHILSTCRDRLLYIGYKLE